MGEIADEYIRVAQMLSGLTFSIGISLMTLDRVKEIEAAAAGDAELQVLAKELKNKLAAVTSPEDHERMAQSYEAFAEINFYLRMKAKGVALSRTPGTGKDRQKRPDFVHQRGTGQLYFEVKALEIADPIFRHKELADRALNIAADLDARARKPGIHFGEPLEISGPKQGHGVVKRIEETIKKVTNNVKTGQIYYGPTILVVGLGRFAGMPQEASGLLPVFFHDAPPAVSSVSGELWQIGFGKAGEQVFELPESDGKSNLAGHQGEDGILRRFAGLVGIAFVIPQLSAEPKIFTLWNKQYDKTLLANQPALTEHDLDGVLYDFSDGINDTRNEDGWAHQVYPARP